MPQFSFPRRGLVARTFLVTGFLTTVASAAPVKRFSVDQRGDFVLIGNTLGQDCGDMVPAPLTGKVGNCGTKSTLADSAPDVYWRSEEPDSAGATADISIKPAQARSTAMLALPPGATLTYARLYWGARLAGNATADLAVTLDRPGGASLAVTADGSSTAPLDTDTAYHSTADVTDFVKTLGPGAFRVSDVDSQNIINLDDSVNFAAWSLVALYELPTDPPRNIVIFDGLERVASGQPSSVSISGFLVPAASSSARLGVVAYEGDSAVLGDSLLFNGSLLSDAQNPADNFFNSSRSVLGTAASLGGDLPRTSGLPGSLSGLDLDIVDITALLKPLDTSATLQATSTGDAYYLATFVTSIATFKPDLSQTAKTVVDLDGGAVLAGDTLEYSILVPNKGNDQVQALVLTDLLPVGLSYVPASLQVTAGANLGPKTDNPGDDQGDYSAATRTLTVRLGTGATALAGGTLGAGESTSIVFRAQVDAGVSPGLLVNQATVAGSDKSGPLVWLSGNGAAPATGTTTLVEQCATDPNCPTVTPVCNTLASPRVCVGCLLDVQCSAAAPVCDLATLSCRGCLDTDPCGDPDKDGLTNAQEAAIGTDPKNPDTDGDSLLDGAEAPPGQVPPDTDGDGTIDALDEDDDGDGLPTKTEIGLATASGQPADADMDGHPNWLDTDADGDNTPDLADGITDTDGDGIPNFLDPKDQDGPLGDLDGDGIPNIKDNCPSVPNADQADTNSDGIGDACQSQGTGGSAGMGGASGTAGEGGAGQGGAGEGGAGAAGTGMAGEGGAGNAGHAGESGQGGTSGNGGSGQSGQSGGGKAGSGQAGAGMGGAAGATAGGGQAGSGGGGKGGESGGAAGSRAGAGGQQAGAAGAAQGGAGTAGKAGSAATGGAAGKPTDPDSEEAMNFAGSGCSASGQPGAGRGPAALLGLIALLRGWRGAAKRRGRAP